MATTDLVPVATQTARRIFGSRRAGRLGPQKDVEQRPPSRGWCGRGSACGPRVFAQLCAPAAPAARTRPAPFSGCSLRSGVQAPPASADAPVFLTPALAPSPLPRVPGQVPTQSLAVPERLSSQTLPPLKPSPPPAPSSSQGLSLAYSEQAKQPWPLSQAPQRPGAQEPGAVRSGTSGLSGPGPCCSPHPPVSRACRGFRGSNFLPLSSRQAGSFVLRKWGCSGSQLRRNKGL